MKYSLIIPVYKNEASISRLLQVLSKMNHDLQEEMEVVFVVDGSPDQSYRVLRDALDTLDFPTQLLVHSRNFGAFPAIRTGLTAARGDYFAVMAADLQEPPELFITLFTLLSADECDVAIGTRKGRKDPWMSRVAASLFWGLYRRLVVRDMPEGGVDVFGCNRAFREQLLKLEESRSSLVALIFWLGFRRKFVDYERQLRQEGKSAWTLKKKIDYMMDSIFAFTDYPIRLLMRIGAIGSVLSITVAMVVLIARLTGAITVPGYAATTLIVLIFGALNLFALGLVGTYAWRGYENSKQRPLAVVSLHTIVAGTRARRIGYSPEMPSKNSTEREALPKNFVSEEPCVRVGVGNVTFHNLKLVRDTRGDLSVGEFIKDIPFEPKRYFVVCNVPDGKIRGEHAHHKCHQFLVCVKGSCTIVVDDGQSRCEMSLNSPNKGIHVPPLIWGIQYKYSSDAILLVFTSEYYETDDYIHSYAEFMDIAANNKINV